MEFFAKRFDTETIVRVRVAHGQIESVSLPSYQEVVEAGFSPSDLPFIGPGLFDLQINGALGIEFSSADLTVEKVVKVFDRVIRDGVFRFCPTITTASREIMIHAARTIVEAVERHPDYASLVAGIHLEGPFISREDESRGAHSRDYCCEYNLVLFDQIQEAARGLIRMVTLSPEYGGADDFIVELASSGVIVAIGHTNASPVEIVQAIDSGAVISTHLGNAANRLLSKWENPVFAQLTDDRIMATVIADGFHLSPMMLSIIFRMKEKKRLILVSDQSAVAGLEPGSYQTNLCEVEVLPNGKVALAGSPNLLAGSGSPLSAGLVNIMAIEKMTLKDAYSLCTGNPAQLLDLPAYSNDESDFLAEESSADFILFQLQEARLGEYGIADANAFIPGKMLLETVIYQGKASMPEPQASSR